MNKKELEKKLVSHLLKESEWDCYSDCDNPVQISDIDPFYQEDGTYIVVLKNPEHFLRIKAENEKIIEFEEIDPLSITTDEILRSHDPSELPFEQSLQMTRNWIVSNLQTCNIQLLTEAELTVFTYAVNASMENSPLRDYDFDMPWQSGQTKFCLTAIKAGVLPWDIYSCEA
jgi:hypothetical protein